MNSSLKNGNVSVEADTEPTVSCTLANEPVSFNTSNDQLLIVNSQLLT